MNYEEKYNEILAWARKNKARLNGVPIEEVLPELAESEDELMMKAVIGILGEDDHPKLCSWLKSLKPQPKQEWSEEDENARQNLIAHFEGKILMLSGEAKKEAVDWLKSLRPSWKPSEDEERLINTSISFLKDFADKGYENAVECIDWLKSKLNGTSTNAK